MTSDHRTLCRMAARWLLDERGCFCAAWEVPIQGGAVFDAIGTTAPDAIGDTVIRCREYDLARNAIMAKHERRMARKRGATPAPLFDGRCVEPSPHTLRRLARMDRGRPRIEVAECKVSRSDWLSDCREQKHRRYEPNASSCWLVIEPEVAGVTLDERWYFDESYKDRIVGRLADDGLTAHWGVVVAMPSTGSRRYLHRVRAAAVLREPEVWEVVTFAGFMARSLGYRGTSDLVGGRSPVAAEMAGEGGAA